MHKSPNALFRLRPQSNSHGRRWLSRHAGLAVTAALLLALLIASIGGPVADAVAPNFAAKQDFATGNSPVWVAVGDLNGDGKPDLAVANSFADTVSVLLNTTAPGAVTPSFAARQNFGTASVPEAVAIGDLNGDGKPDLAVPNFSSGSVSVLLNTTAPGSVTFGFAPKQDFAAGFNARAVALGDLNGDGRLDLAVANQSAGNVSVLLNITAPGAVTPNFAAKQDFVTGTNPQSVAVGDVNGDGIPDLAVGNAGGGSNSISVLLNTAAPGAVTPSFAAKQDFGTGSAPQSVTLGDLNGDGQLDLAVANSGAGANTLSVLFNTTAPGAVTPSFAAKQDFATGTAPFGITAGDVNGDGRPDLIAGNFQGGNGNTVSVLRNTTAPGATTPSFAAKQDFATGLGPVSITMGDLNGDGLLDLATANGGTGTNTVSVLLNTTALGPATPGFSAKQEFATGVTPASVTAGDFNGDGKLDVAVVNVGDSTVSVLLGTTAPGSATANFAAKQDFATGATPQSATMGDLNRDGKLDLAVANQGENTVSVLLNTTAAGAAAPSFAAKQDFATGSMPKSVAVGDLNGDGKLDLVVANLTINSPFVSVLLNTTATGAAMPSFAAKQDFATSSSSESVTLGDLNGDGKLDLALVNTNASTVSVLLNTTVPGSPTANFAAKQDFATGNIPLCIALGDLNGDGKLDVAAGNNNAGTVSVLLNTTAPGAAAPGFAPKQDFATGFNPRSISFGDLNGDGRLDLTIPNSGSGNVSVLVNTTAPGAATPSLAPKRDFAQPIFPRAATVGDVNGDGKLDLIVPNSQNNSVAVLFNAPTVVAATGVTRQQGTPAANSQIATVTNYGGDGGVIVTVTSANPSNGVTISNLLNTNGSVTADVVASCSASNAATFILQATDGSSTVTGTLTIVVTANTAPTLTYSTPQSVAFNGSLNVSPTTATDNGSITGYSVVTVSPALTTAPAVNASGVVAITNARPAGSHVITIRATDNCGSITDASFTLNVDKAATTTGVTSSLNPSALGENVSFTATVTSTGGTPSGAVQFKIDGVNVGGPVTLSGSGVAQLATSSLTATTHTVTVDYGGDANFAVSTGSLSGGQVVNNRPLVSLTPSSYNVGESDGFVTIGVTRSGDTAPAVSVDYSTSFDNGVPCSTANGVATPKCDFTAAAGKLNFAAGETNKTIIIPLTQDSFVEGPETFSLSLSNPTAGTGVANPSTASVTIADDATEPATNPIEDARNFVRQHYHDFLNREPDQSGWDFWTNQITSCGTDVRCNEVKRIDVSASFFLSIEFQQTGYLVERVYKVGYGDGTGTSTFGGQHQLPVPVVRVGEFLTDTQRIGRGVVVLAPGWEQLLENNKQAYALEFVQTSRFVTAFPTTMTPAQFVNQLNQNAGNVLSPAEIVTAINLFGGAPNSSNSTARAQAVRQVAEDNDLYNAEFNRAFVLAQYFGYLRRNPSDSPESTLDYTGYDFWLTKLNQFNGNYINAEMVKAFLSSLEYRNRFGP